jgi:hypothetical protein
MWQGACRFPRPQARRRRAYAADQYAARHDGCLDARRHGFDLVGYEAQIGSLDAVATILAELAEQLDSDKLVARASTVPLPWTQRLGYLPERIDEAPRAQALKEFERAHARDAVALLASVRADDHPRDRYWRLIVNAQVEAET